MYLLLSSINNITFFRRLHILDMCEILKNFINMQTYGTTDIYKNDNLLKKALFFLGIVNICSYVHKHDCTWTRMLNVFLNHSPRWFCFGVFYWTSISFIKLDCFSRKPYESCRFFLFSAETIAIHHCTLTFYRVLGLNVARPLCGSKHCLLSHFPSPLGGLLFCFWDKSCSGNQLGSNATAFFSNSILKINL